MFSFKSAASRSDECRLNVMVKLLAGIATTSFSANPDFSASGHYFGLKQRNAPAWSRAAQVLVERLVVRGAVCTPFLLKGP